MQNTEKIKELSEALERECAARAEAEAAVKASEAARQEFVSLVAHELRVPMTSIKGYTDLLLKGIMGPVNEAQTNFLQVIRANVERMSRMVSDLSDINKIEGERLDLNITAVQLDEALDEALALHQKDIEQKEHRLSKHIPEDLPPLLCDQKRFVQILDNLVSNAIQYSAEQTNIAIAAAHITKGDAHDWVQISVQDQGIGILENEQDRIFEKFFRASDEETRQTPGNGLALHLSRLLLKLQNGCIWFESERGQGTTFYITLPASSPEPE